MTQFEKRIKPYVNTYLIDSDLVLRSDPEKVFDAILKHIKENLDDMLVGFD